MEKLQRGAFGTGTWCTCMSVNQYSKLLDVQTGTLLCRTRLKSNNIRELVRVYVNATRCGIMGKSRVEIQLLLIEHGKRVVNSHHRQLHAMVTQLMPNYSCELSDEFPSSTDAITEHEEWI
jgi:hypothetical protein